MTQLFEGNPAQPLADNENDLVIRSAAADDCDALMAFNSRIHFFVPEHETTIATMTRDLMSGRLPGFQPGNFKLILEKSTGKIVSAMALIFQTWSYGGIPIKMGRPELVGTDPTCRGRGLIREQFRIFHALCRERGCLAQAITGIPFFYRQFGYELGLASEGGIAGALPLPAFAADADRFRIAPARAEDLVWIEELYQRGSERYLLTCPRDAQLWDYEMARKSPTNIHKVEVNAITTPGGGPVGFFMSHKGFGPVSEKAAFWYELLPGFEWQSVTPAILLYLATQGQDRAMQQGGQCVQVALRLGGLHPSYAIAQQWLPKRIDPGVWYVRVPDLPAFLRKVEPVLNKRLAASGWSGFSGNLKISFYKEGINLAIRDGIIDQVNPYTLETWEDADTAFPYLSFLQLLFGYRNLGELQYAYADCWCDAKIKGLMETLFPKMPSAIWGIA